MTILRLSEEKIPLVQGFIRQYLGKKQFVSSIVMQVNKKIYSGDNLMNFLQTNHESNNNTMVDVQLIQYYTYDFVYLNQSIQVVLKVSKDPINSLYNKISEIAWSAQGEKVTINGPANFIDMLRIALNTRMIHIDDYHLPNQPIQFKIYDQKNPKAAAEAYNYYKTYCKNYTKGKQLRPNVWAITQQFFNDIDRNPEKYMISVKIDGLRHICVVYNNILLCVQYASKTLVYYYTLDNNPGFNGIFDAECSNGVYYVFDCYHFQDSIGAQAVNQYTLNYRLEFVSLACKSLPQYFTENYRIGFTGDWKPYEELFSKRGIAAAWVDQFYDIYPKIRTFFEGEPITFLPDYGDTYKRVLDEYIQRLARTQGTPELQNYLEFCKTSEPMGNYNTDPLSALKIDPKELFMHGPDVVKGLIGWYYTTGFKEEEKRYKIAADEFMTYAVTTLKDHLSLSAKTQWLLSNTTLPNDGVIFTSTDPVTFISNSLYALKWKPTDKLSMDAVMQFDLNSVIDHDKRKMVNAIFYGSELVNQPVQDTQGTQGTQGAKPVRTLTEIGRTLVELNNFNGTLPACENNDIITSDQIVEVVPLFEQNEKNEQVMKNVKLLRVRYDRGFPNSVATIKTIIESIKNYDTMIYTIPQSMLTLVTNMCDVGSTEIIPEAIVNDVQTANQVQQDARALPHGVQERVA